MKSIFEELMGSFRSEANKISRNVIKKNALKIDPKYIKVESLSIFEAEEFNPDLFDRKFPGEEGFVEVSEEERTKGDLTSATEAEVVMVIAPEDKDGDGDDKDPEYSLVGSYVYKCPICGSNYACNCEAHDGFVICDEEGKPTECPVCGDTSPQILRGVIDFPTNGESEIDEAPLVSLDDEEHKAELAAKKEAKEAAEEAEKAAEDLENLNSDEATKGEEEGSEGSVEEVKVEDEFKEKEEVKRESYLPELFGKKKEVAADEITKDELTKINDLVRRFQKYHPMDFDELTYAENRPKAASVAEDMFGSFEKLYGIADERKDTVRGWIRIQLEKALNDGISALKEEFVIRELFGVNKSKLSKQDQKDAEENAEMFFSKKSKIRQSEVDAYPDKVGHKSDSEDYKEELRAYFKQAYIKLGGVVEEALEIDDQSTKEVDDEEVEKIIKGVVDKRPEFEFKREDKKEKDILTEKPAKCPHCGKFLKAEDAGEDTLEECDASCKGDKKEDKEEGLHFDENRFNMLFNAIVKENYTSDNARVALRKVSSRSKGTLRFDYELVEGRKITKGTMLATGFKPKSETMVLRVRDHGAFTESFEKTPSFMIECVTIHNTIVPRHVEYDYTVLDESYRVFGKV